MLRLGFLANFLSHPVISGFITAAAVQIAAGQLAPLLGIRAHGENLLDLLISLVPNLVKTNPRTAVVGLASLAFLFWVRSGLKPLLLGFGLNERASDIMAKAGPAMAIIGTTWRSGDSDWTDVVSASSARSPRVFLTSDCQPSTGPSG